MESKKYGMHNLIALLFILWAIIYLLQFYNLNGALSDRDAKLPSMSNIRLVHHDLIRKYQCLANVPQKEIDDLQDQGYKIIEIDYEKNGMPAKLIVVYEEV